MSIKKGKLQWGQVSKDTKAYSLDNKFQPTFVNGGTVPVTIMLTTLPPGGSFKIDLPFIVDNDITIQFDKTGVENPICVVNVYWGIPPDLINNCTN